MATTYEIQKQLDIIKRIESDKEDAKRACRTLEEMYQMDCPEAWSWITIHASDECDEIRICGGSHPEITREMMKNMIEAYYITPLLDALAEAKSKLREMVSEDYE